MPSPLTIGIDARAADEIPGGRGRVVRELLGALAARGDDHRYVLYCRRSPGRIRLDERFSWRELRLKDPAWMLSAAASASRDCDVFLSTNSYVIGWFVRAPSAIIVHDLIPFMPEIPDRKSTRLNSSHYSRSRMPSSA